MFGIPYHFLTVHFPLVLVVTATLYDSRGLHDIGYRMVVGCAATSALGVMTGLMLSGGRLSELTVHAGTGIVGALLIIVVAMLRYSRRARGEEELAVPAAWILLQATAGLALIIAAFSGHRAVLGY
jgi:hypothetical protein